MVAALLLLWSVAALGGASESESCPAGSAEGCAGSGVLAASPKCVSWRQTAGCDPKGNRERQGDKPCTSLIEPGRSGYCECSVGSARHLVRQVTCDHRPFRCDTECLQVLRYTCVSWRQTKGCDANGEREAQNDKPCDQEISARSSGFCECGAGRVVKKPGCEHGEFEEPFSCRDVCAGEPDLYEELGVDSGASEKDIKQAFRKLSLKFHPDKTQDDPVLTARFAAMREAYDIIGNQEQRSLYDAAGLQMVLDAKNHPDKGPTSSAELEVSLESMYNGEEMKVQLSRKVICRGCAGKSTERCRKCTTACANELQLVNVQMGPMIVQQRQEVRSKEKCRMENAKLLIHVEQGMSNGDSIMFKNQGEQQPKKLPGDLKLVFKEKKHQLFRRVGVDLHIELQLSLREALLGFERSIVHLDGRRLTFSYKGVTKPSGVLKITGEGMPHRGDSTQRGNLLARCTIIMPDDGRQWLKENAS
mmetsp:Transcript_8169/g.17835  ORF Transcript_8169/g.17835 Transcript_8169/m.17835 type:complete len:475 (-) Transcript_8169:106-1530(-)